MFTADTCLHRAVHVATTGTVPLWLGVRRNQRAVSGKTPSPWSCFLCLLLLLCSRRCSGSERQMTAVRGTVLDFVAIPGGTGFLGNAAQMSV